MSDFEVVHGDSTPREQLASCIRMFSSEGKGWELRHHIASRGHLSVPHTEGPNETSNLPGTYGS